MAIGMMGGDNKKLIFHDFLAMGCGNSPETVEAAANTASAMEAEASVSAGISSIGDGLVLGTGNLVSSRPALNNSEVFLIHGRKDDSVPESSNSFSARKRNNSDSTYMAFINDKSRSVCVDSPESSRSLKMLGKEVISDRSRKYHKDDVQFQIQPPLRPTSLHSLSSRPVLIPSKWEQSIPTNSGSLGHYPSPIAQSGMLSSYASKDLNFGAMHMSQLAADEGSRTGIKGSGVLNIVTSSSSGPNERNIASFFPYGSRPYSTQINMPESSDALRYHGRQNVGRQMTIFYAGQAHVFDDVHPNKAEIIMALAGSYGGSWSTTYLQKTTMFPSAGEVKVFSEENNQEPISQVGRTTLTRDIQGLTPGDQPSRRVANDGRVMIQAPLLSAEGKRNAS